MRSNFAMQKMMDDKYSEMFGAHSLKLHLIPMASDHFALPIPACISALHCMLTLGVAAASYIGANKKTCDNVWSKKNPL